MTMRAFFTAGALITGGMLAGRVLGLVREMLLAAEFGAGHAAGFAIALLLIPDFLTGALLGGTAVSAVLIPAFAGRSDQQKLALFWQSVLLVVGVFSLIALALYTQSGAIVQLFAGGAQVAGAGAATAFMLLSLPLGAATWVFVAYLQYQGSFAAFSFGTVIFNSVIVLALWLGGGDMAMLGAAIFCAIAGRFLLHALSFMRHGGAWQNPLRAWQLQPPLLAAYGSTLTSNLLGLLPQYVPYLVVAASGASMAAFNYAFKLLLLPVSLILTCVQMLLLPWLVKRLARGRNDDIAHAASRHLAWVFSLPVAIALCLGSAPIVALCFGYGAMTEGDVEKVANAFAIAIWALPFLLLGGVWQQIFFARRLTRPVLVASAAQLVILVPLCVAGYGAAAENGLCAAYVLTQVATLGLFAWQARRHGLLAHYRCSPVYIKTALAAAIAMAPFAWVLHGAALSPPAGLALATLAGAAGLLAALAAYGPARHYAWLAYKARLS